MQDVLNLRGKPEKILLRTMSENPAFEWNSRLKQETSGKPSLLLYPVLQHVNCKVNFAPAIVYRKRTGSVIQEHLVAGISFELNAYTDVNLYISSQQIRFFSSLLVLLTTMMRSKEAPSVQPKEKASLDFSVPAEILLTCNSVKLMLYEKEEEESQLQPLIMTTFTQPHIFSVISPGNQKVTLSLYTVQVSVPTPGTRLEKLNFMSEDMFTNVLLESCSAVADAMSGIKPPFLNTSVEGLVGENLNVSFVVGRPLKVVLDPDKVEQVLSCYRRFFKTSEVEERKPIDFRYSETDVNISVTNSSLIFNFGTVRETCVEHAFSLFTVSSKVTANEQFNVVSNVSIKHLRSSVRLDKLKHSVLDPVNLDVTVNLTTDLLLTPVKGFMIFNIGRLNVHLGPHQLFVLARFVDTVHTTVENRTAGAEAKSGVRTLSRKPVEGEHFTDDLRLGTFTIEENCPDLEIPPPYRVCFNKNSLTWSYPRPRTLTRMVILPLPLTLAKEGTEQGDAVACQLQFWSGSRSCWILYQHFQLREGNVTHVDLPLCTDRRSCEFAQTWRVQMFPDSNIRDEIPCSLLSALRVDSYLSAAMLPDFQVVFRSKHLELTLHNQIQFSGCEMPEDLVGLNLDNTFPTDHPFSSLSLQSMSSEVSIWKGSTDETSLKIISKGRFGANFTDYMYLAKHTLLKPCAITLKVQIQDNLLDVFADVGKAELTVGPFGLHTFTQSAKLWNDANTRLESESCSVQFTPLSQILVVNETSQVLIFGQSGTDEKIHIESRTVVMYTWRSHKAGNLLYLASTKQIAGRSDPFPLRVGETLVGLEDGNQVLVQIQDKSTTVKIVRLSGLVTFANLLQEHLELKIVSENSEDKLLSGSFERPVSFLTKQESLRIKIKFFALFTPWSGEICLKKSRKSVLVRLPCREKGTSVTVWCNIVSENVGSENKILVVFSPMYILHSQVPGRLLTRVQCGDLETEVILPKFNSCSQLEPQHAPENKFNLSFQLNPEAPASSPPVSVSWGIIDQVRSSRVDTQPINGLLAEITKINRKKLKPIQTLEDLDISEMKVVEQCGTDCQVRFEELHPLLNTLKIKVHSKLLFVNTTEFEIVLNSEKDSWYLDPNSVFHPPKLDSAVRLGILLETGEEHLGPALEITDHDWTYVSLLPNYDKIIPKSGHMVYQVKFGEQGMLLNVHSEVRKGIRVITLQSMFVFTNQLDYRIQIRQEISCRNSLSIKYNVKEEVEETRTVSVDLEPGTQKQALLWTMKDRGDGKPDFLVSLGISGETWTRPISVPCDRDLRQCVTLSLGGDGAVPCLLMNHRQDGQIHVVLLQDDRPQLRLTNKLGEDIRFREVSGTEYLVPSGGYTFHTCRYIEEGFPFIQQPLEKNGKKCDDPS